MIKIREYRTRLDMTMKELGDKVGVTESAISLYELGKREPKYEMLLKISEALKTDVPHLLGMESPTDTHPLAEDEDVAYILNLMHNLDKANRSKVVAMLKVMFPEGGTK